MNSTTQAYLHRQTPKTKIIATHFRPDVDALLAVWAALRLHPNTPVEFVPTGLRAEEQHEDVLYLDISSGLKESNNLSAGAYMCTLLPAEEAEAMREVGEYVTRHDQGEWEDGERQIVAKVVSLVSIVNALKDSMNDAQLLDYICPIFDALLISGKLRLQAQQLAKSAEIIGKVAIVRQPEGSNLVFGVQRFLSPEIKVILTVIGNNMSALSLDSKESDLSRLQLPESPQPKVQTWFLHPKGFLAQWGDVSGKGKPAEIPPPISAEEFAKIINAAHTA